MTPHSLAGRTVVVTRTGSRAEEMTLPLEQAGAAVLELPLTAQTDASDEGEALRAAAGALESFAWVVVTSVNAAERLLDVIDEVPHGLRVAAVGPTTAAAFRAAGVEMHLVPDTHSAAALVDAFPASAADERRLVLFPSGDRAPATVVEGLRAKGWDVQRVEAYRTVTLAPPEPALLAQVSAADVIVFTAASSVHAFAALRTLDGQPPDPPALVVCIGPTTGSAARAAGWRGVSEARRASSEAIVTLLRERLGPSAASGS